MGLIMEINNEYQRYQRAKKQVEKIKGFYVHFATFIIIMALLVYVNLKYTPEYLWFFWSMFGWGIGVFFSCIEHISLVLSTRMGEKKNS